MASGRASGGGVKSARDVRKYMAPQGPTNILDPQGPGIHGQRLRRGTQGPSLPRNSQAGRPGLGGQNKGKGMNRHG
jgi:hypothetical protein